MSACSTQVPLNPDISSAQLDKAPDYSKVLIIPSRNNNSTIYTESGLLVAGVTQQWDIMVSEALEESSLGFFGNYYHSVEIKKPGSKNKSCNDCSLIVHANIEKINISKILMQSEVKFSFRISNPMYREIITLTSTGKSPLIAPEVIGITAVSYVVPLFGNFIGKYLVANSIENAFEDAYKKLTVDMEKEINHGVLARTWLPKNLIKKDNYGRSEYSAERLARTQGCDLRTDGLKRLSQWPMESYDAYCWGKETFRIKCEYGHCAINENRIPSLAKSSY